MSRAPLSANRTPGSIALNVLMSAAALFVNGLGVHLTIRANIGAGPWDVFSLGLSKTVGILYGNASILIAFTVLLIDLLLREPIGLSMIIDSIVVGKSVDFFNAVNITPVPRSFFGSVLMMFVGLVIIGYTCYFYMKASLGCGPRDTLLVGLTKRFRRLPIGVVSIGIMSLVTLTGWLLGGPVGVGTLICAFATGPIMDMAFRSVRFDATGIRHQNLAETGRVLRASLRRA